VLVLRADDAASATNPDVIALRQAFPEKAGVGDEIYAACQQWFAVVSTLPAAGEALRHAKETQAKYLADMAAAKSSNATTKEKARVQANIKWLNGPFADYLNKWQQLTGQTAAPGVVAAPKPTPAGAPAPDIPAVIKAATNALAMVGDIKSTDASFLNAHTGLKAELGALGTTAQAILDANGMPTDAQAEALRTAVTTAIKQAQIESTRATEKAAAKAKAKDLMARLRTL